MAFGNKCIYQKAYAALCKQIYKGSQAVGMSFERAYFTRKVKRYCVLQFARVVSRTGTWQSEGHFNLVLGCPARNRSERSARSGGLHERRRRGPFHRKAAPAASRHSLLGTVH